jgi:thioredoxin reductase
MPASIAMDLARVLRPIFLRSTNTKTVCSAIVRVLSYIRATSPPSFYSSPSSSALFSTMPSNEGPDVLQAGSRVLVIGGSYSGLAATVNLIDLCDGKQPRFTSTPTDVVSPKTKLPIDITIVDERDGYCTYYASPCAGVCNVCPLPRKAYSHTLAMEWHNIIQTRDVSKETPKHIVSRWILSCFSKPLCLSIAMSVTKFFTREGGIIIFLQYSDFIIDHLIGNPLAFASDDAAFKSWTRFRDIPALKSPNVNVLQGSVTSIDCENKIALILDTVTEQRRQERYDYLLVASGLRRTSPVVPKALSRDQFLAEAKSHTKAIRDAKEGVVVIGGGWYDLCTLEFRLIFYIGAVGIEMASEIKVIEPWQKVTLVHSRDKLLSAEPLPDDFKERSLDILKETGVEVIMGQRVIETTAVQSVNGSTSWNLTLSSGPQIKAGHVITAISRSTPTSGYLPSAVLNKDGYVKIDASCERSPTYLDSANIDVAYGSIAIYQTQAITSQREILHLGLASSVVEEPCTWVIIVPSTSIKTCSSINTDIRQTTRSCRSSPMSWA